MEWLFLIPMLWAGILLCAPFARWWGRTCVSQLDEASAAISDGVRFKAAVLAAEREQQANMRRLRQWLEMRFANGSTVAHPDAAAARKQAPFIRQLIDQELPEAIRRCLQNHHVAALGAGANYMWEIAEEPECLGLRQTVVGMGRIAIEMLQEYPLLLEDSVLMGNLVTLRTRIVPVCHHCPYLQHPVASAPLLCPSAITAGISPDSCRRREN